MNIDSLSRSFFREPMKINSSGLQKSLSKKPIAVSEINMVRSCFFITSLIMTYIRTCNTYIYKITHTDTYDIHMRINHIACIYLHICVYKSYAHIHTSLTAIHAMLHDPKAHPTLILPHCWSSSFSFLA